MYGEVNVRRRGRANGVKQRYAEDLALEMAGACPQGWVSIAPRLSKKGAELEPPALGSSILVPVHGLGRIS